MVDKHANTLKIRFDIILSHYWSDKLFDPFLVYLDKCANISFALNTNKPKDDSELVSFFDFDYYSKQDDDILTHFFGVRFS